MTLWEKEELITDCAYLYSVWSGTLKCHKGIIKDINSSRHKDTGRFASKDGTVVWCSKNPGEVYNAIIWLPEKDDKKAKRLLVEYYDSRIMEEEAKIAELQKKIDILLDW